MQALGRAMCATVLLAGLSCFAVAGCSDTDDGMVDNGPATGTVVVQFDHVVDGTPLEPNVGSYPKAADETYSVSKLQYVVTEIGLDAETTVRADGDFAYAGLHFRDEAKSETRALTIPGVPAGDYSHLVFRFGIEGSVNVPGTFPDLDDVEMDWPDTMPGDGYHYMKQEGVYVPQGGSQKSFFATHTGPTANVDYSFEVALDLDAGAGRHGFTVAANDTVTVRIEMDLNEWYEDPEDYAFDTYHGTGMGIMGNADAQAKLKGNGHSVFSLGDVTTN